MKGEATSVDIVSTYCRRAYKLGGEYHLTADEMFTEAIEKAKAKDLEREEMVRKGLDLEESLSPLHGLPMSVKDQLMYPGTICSVGTFSKCGKRLDEKTHAVELLERAGAIPFVKSNVALWQYRGLHLAASATSPTVGRRV